MQHVLIQSNMAMDGCGMSRYNLVNAKQFVDVLSLMSNHIHKDYFLNSFPIGGTKESTLAKRLKNTNGKIRAETGTMSGVSSLSGYAFSPKYGPLAFSILINGYVGSSAPYRQLQYRICKWLVK